MHPAILLFVLSNLSLSKFILSTINMGAPRKEIDPPPFGIPTVNCIVCMYAGCIVFEGNRQLVDLLQLYKL